MQTTSLLQNSPLCHCTPALPEPAGVVLSKELCEAARLAEGIKSTMMDLVEESQVKDPRRWSLFLSFLRAADHELGKCTAGTSGSF